MRTPTATLTPQELAIMKVVWDLESATVRDVYERLRSQRDVAYTTVLTMMKILEQKGYVKKARVDRAFVYRVFDGASRPMLLHLVKHTQLSDKERKALLRAIEEVEE